MLVFYPEFDAEPPAEVEIIFFVDASCSMKVVRPRAQSLAVKRMREGSVTMML